MKDLIPLNEKEYQISEEELSIAKLTEMNNGRLLLILIPIGVWFLLKKNPHLFSSPSFFRTYDTKLSVPNLTSPHYTNTADFNTFDKMTQLLEGIKKVSSIQELSKNFSKTRTSSGKFNKDMINEVINLFGHSLSEDSRSQIHNMVNMLSMMDKVKDIKKVMEIQKVFKSDGNEDPNDQMDRMIEMIKPMLPEEQAKNIDGFKKMAQMMKMMSMFDTSQSEGEEDDEEEVE